MKRLKVVVISVLVWLIIGGTVSGFVSGCSSKSPITYVGDPVAMRGIYEAGYEMGWRTAAEQLKEEHSLLRLQIILLQKKLNHEFLDQEYWDDGIEREIRHLAKAIERAER